MNDIYKTNIKDKLSKAMSSEGLGNFETAGILGFPIPYISMMKNPDLWVKCPPKAWETASLWVNSGQSLREYSEKHGRVLPQQQQTTHKLAVFCPVTKEEIPEPALRDPAQLNSSPAPESSPDEKDEPSKVMEEEEKHSVNLAEIGWILGLQSKGKTTEQISKELKIYSKIVEKILSESTKEKENTIQVTPGIRHELINELQLRGDRLRDELTAITKLLEQYI